MNLFLILNENPEGSHSDVYNSLYRLENEGFINSWKIYPFKAKLTGGMSSEEVISEIVELIESIQPELILWSHTGKLKTNKSKLLKIQNIRSNPSIGYWDADIYHPFFKPIPREVTRIIKNCDVSFWPGFNLSMRKFIGKDIRYVPLSTDAERFDKKREVKIKYDVVMVGNYIGSKIPFKTFPGSKERKKISEIFYQELGARFCVYGDGWNEKYSKGPIKFEEQFKAWQSGKISVGINNLHADYYFSNRLPISLSSGVLMLHNYEKGINKVFEKVNYPYFFSNSKEAWEMAKYLLSKNQEELDSIVEQYKSYVLEEITMYRSIKYMINVLKDYYYFKNNYEKLPITRNPWINSPTL